MKRRLTLAAFAVMTGFAFAEGPDFETRRNEVDTVLRPLQLGKAATYSVEAEKQARQLIKDFPDRKEPYVLLQRAAEYALRADQEDRALALYKELANDNVPAGPREEAKIQLARRDMINKPLDMKFTALDGREVDISSMKGKVIFIDFWATWCCGCVADLPKVKAAYEKLNSKGFEVVAISFDDDKTKLESYVKDKELPWPQYFDGKGWKNAYGKKYGMLSLPQCWLVNKQGVLVDMDARQNLEARVEKLLAE